MKKLFVLLLLILTIHFTLSAGVSTPYWPGNALRIHPGETKMFDLRLQNMAGDETDWHLTVHITKDDYNIATLPQGEQEYKVAFGTENVRIPVSIHIPQNIPPESVLSITFSLDPVQGLTEEGTVQLAQAMDVTIPIEIIAYEQQKQQIPTYVYLIGIMILLVIIILIWLSLQHKKKHGWKRRIKLKEHPHRHPKHHQQTHHRRHKH